MLLCVQSGQLYNAEDGRKALRDVFALGLFDNVQIFPKPNQKDESKVQHAPPLASGSLAVLLPIHTEVGDHSKYQWTPPVKPPT